MAASPSYFPRITEMLVPGHWGEKLCLHQPFRKRIRKQSGCPVRKKTKNIFGYNSRLWSVTLHTKLGRCGKPEPQILELCLNQFKLIAAIKNGLEYGVLAILPPPHCSLCPYPQKLMGSANFCNLYSLGSDMTCFCINKLLKKKKKRKMTACAGSFPS